MKKVIEKLSTPKMLLISGVGFIVLCLLANTVWQQDFAYLTQKFNYTPQYVSTFLSQIGLTGRTAHTRILIVDCIMVISYCAFLIGADYKLSCRVTKSCKWITVLTFSSLLLGIIQLIEVVCMFFIINNYPIIHSGLISISSVITKIKIVYTPMCFLLPIILLSAILIKKIIRSR